MIVNLNLQIVYNFDMQYIWHRRLFFTANAIVLKRSFGRSFDAIYGKIRSVASEKAVVELLMTKCFLPQLYCDTEACKLIKSEISSLNFAIIYCVIKIFCINSK